MNDVDPKNATEIEMFEDAHKISAQELKEEKDWRDMSAEEWDKMLEGVDHEKNWTKKLKTDDQTVLMTAKEAQKMESHALSKYQEVQLVGSTSV